jgi:hypothetical protein
MSRLFRQKPPIDIINIILHEIGFTGLNDTKLFCAEELQDGTIEAWVPLLEPYYLPCKARRYLDQINPHRIITILRHVLPFHDYGLTSYERLHLGKKRTVYQIHRATPRMLAQGEEIRVLFL